MQNSPKTKTKPSCCKTNPGVSVDARNKAKKNVIKKAPNLGVKALESNNCKCKKKCIKTSRKPAAVGNVNLREPTERIKWSKDTSKLANINETEDDIEAKFEALMIRSGLGNAFFDMFRKKKNESDEENKRLSITKGLHDPNKTPSTMLYRTSIGSYLTLAKWKIFNYGEKGSGYPTKSGKVQEFHSIRDNCLKNRTLFEDPEFPCTEATLTTDDQHKNYEWKRPIEIYYRPHFFIDGFSRFDIRQGGLGDCWFLAVAASITLYLSLFEQVVPCDQGFNYKYAGIFHFRFWQYGRWIDVVVDDRLPTLNGELAFVHSTAENEFWSALLEKAYAKLHNSYESLDGGMTREAMEDFTGGIAEVYDLNNSPPNLFKILMRAHERSSLITCSIIADPNVVEAETPEGLVKGHSYTVTGVQVVAMLGFREIPLIRIRNPWGNSCEWNGPWCDGAPEWNFITDDEKKELGLTFDPDGEFWMSFKDFKEYFDSLEICNLNPDVLIQDDDPKNKHKKKWEVTVFDGEWVRGVSAGGCRNYLDTFWHNPQYRITLTQTDDDSDLCTVIVGVMQKNRRKLQKIMGDDVLHIIGFSIYYLPKPNKVPKPLDMDYFEYHEAAARSQVYSNLREVCDRFQLHPGTYCIVPTTFEPQEEAQFLLRVYTEKKIVMEAEEKLTGFKLVATIDAKMKEEFTPKEKDETDKIYKYFLEVAGDSEEVDWEELKNILDYAMRREVGFEGFSKDICRSMIAMLNEDRSGRLGFLEFQNLWVSLRNWKTVWRSYHTEKSGTLSGFEFGEALNSAGYSLNIQILNILMHRYGNKKGQISFDDFIMCAIKLKTMIDIFNERDFNKNNNACFSIEEWLECTLNS